VLQRGPDRGTHAAGGTSANGVHHYHGCSGLVGYGAIHIGFRTKLLNAETG